MTLVDSYLPWIKSFLVFGLLLSIFKNHDGFDITVSSSIVKQSILTGVNFLEFTSIFYQFHKTIIVVVSDSYHRWCFLELIMRSIRQYLFFEKEVHNISISCSSQQMENISFIFSQGPHVHIRIIDQKLNTFDVILNDGIVKCSVSFLALEVDVVWVPYLFQNVLNIVKHTLKASQHQRSHLLFIIVLEISSTLHQHT